MSSEVLEVLPPGDRSAVVAHVGRIAFVANQQPGTFRLDEEHFSHGQIAEATRYLAQPDVHTCITRDTHGMVVAGGSVRFVPEQGAEITYVHCLPSAQGMGYGRRILGTLLEHVSRAEILPAYLYVNPENAPALRLYASVGFDPVPRRADDPMIPGWLRMEIDDHDTLQAAVESLQGGFRTVVSEAS